MRARGIGLRLDGAVEDGPQIMFRQSTKRKIDDLHHERSDDSESSENYPLLDDHEVDDDTSRYFSIFAEHFHFGIIYFLMSCDWLILYYNVVLSKCIHHLN